MTERAPVLMLGLDAAELALIRHFMEDGTMPALAQLRQRGCFGALDSPALFYAGGVWPSFYTGQDVPSHGIFHNKLWRPDAMRCEVPTDQWIGSRPFWERLSARGCRVCIVDVPMVIGRPRALNGIYLGGWGTHDLISKGSWPASLWGEMQRRYGAPLMPAEHFGAQSAEDLERLVDSLLLSTEQMQRIAIDLLARGPWDFSCVVFGAMHRAGHYLWDLSQVDPPNQATHAKLTGALSQIYAANDRAIAGILDRVRPGTLIVAFAVHGMGPNPGWADLTADILDAARHGASGQAPKKGLLYALKRRMPFEWVRPLLRRLPASLTDRLVSAWSARMYDWRTTDFFPAPMDHAGYIRVNLRGRERNGIVAPGAAYERACEAIEELFGGLRDRNSGQPIARRIVRAYAESPSSAPYRHLVPDLIVPWEGPSATRTRELYSRTLPTLRFQVPPRLPSGRSGNHTGHGWFAACGPGVAPGSHVDGHDILDLAPTVARHLGLENAFEFEGRAIPFDGQTHDR